jgi:hypothetical protein
MKSDNKTLHGIKGDTERYIWILWSLIVLLSSLIGDSIILIGTIKYKAIRQHKLILAVMQHMAVCDLLQAVLRVLPGITVLIADRWVLGELICHVVINIGWVSGGVAMFLTCCMTTLKLITVKQPLRAGTWSSKLGHRICTAMWLLMLSLYTPILIGNLSYLRKTLYFSYMEYECAYDYSSSSIPTWYLKYFVIAFIVTYAITYILLLVTSIFLLILATTAASQHGHSLRWEGIATVLLTVLVLLVSNVPYGAIFVASLVGVEYDSALWLQLQKLSFLNVMANFFVYSLTVPSFRRFLNLKMSEILSAVRQSCQQRAPQGQRQNQTQQLPTQNTKKI